MSSEFPRNPVSSYILPNPTAEYVFIAQQIQAALSAGKKPQDIAIIARKHAVLEDCARVLQMFDIPVYYERKRNILEVEPVRQLVQMLQFVNSLSVYGAIESDELLPEILAYPFWGISQTDIWKLSLQSYQQRKTWLEIMQQASQPQPETLAESAQLESAHRISEIAHFFIQLSKQAISEPAERIIDLLMGVTDVSADDEYEDVSEDITLSENQSQINKVKPNFTSPFKKYYFDKESVKKELSPEYIQLLSALRVLISAVRSHQIHTVVTISQVVSYLDLLNQHKKPLLDTTAFGSQRDGVNILTSHGSKGLEFDTVYIIHATRDHWLSKKGKSAILKHPSNLPLMAEADNEDDKFRLFFVAATRAKQNLILTHSATNSKGDEVNAFPILPNQCETIPITSFSEAQLVQIAGTISRADFSLQTDQKTLLAGVLENYQLSVTHLQNFIDVEHTSEDKEAKRGPQKFLQHNLLRFPQAKSNSAAYGTAMHAVMKYWHDWASTHSGQTIEFDELFMQFQAQLLTQRMLKTDFTLTLEKGKKALLFYYEKEAGNINPAALLEQSFKYEGVVIGKSEAKITGQIDKMEIYEKEKTILVTDFKTGKAIFDWKKDGSKAWKYGLQLTFYKLLVEGSRSLHNYKVTEGVLEFLDSGLEQHPPSSVLSLHKTIDETEVEFLAKLAEVVYNKIINLDFPDVSGYPQTFAGTKQFAQDLVEGKI